jgi:hypothetical protein
MKNNKLIINNNGIFYIKIRAAGMHPLTPYIDRMRIFRFKKISKSSYLLLDDAINWHEKEIKNSSYGGYPKTLNLLIQIREKFQKWTRPLTMKKNRLSKKKMA